MTVPIKNQGFIAYAKDALEIMGKTIREYRLSKDMSQDELGERIGVSRKTIAAIESGSGKTNIGAVFLAAAVLKINLFDADERLMKNTLKSKREISALLPKSVSKTKASLKVNNDF